MPMLAVADYLLKAIIQIGVMTIIPLAWYYTTTKQATMSKFALWLGVKSPGELDKLRVITRIAGVYLVTLAANIAVMLSGHSARTINTGPASSLAFLTIFALRTGIGEEIFYRGFIAKRMISWLGFTRGNVLQAAVFAFPHFYLISSASLPDRLARTINAFLLGYTFGHTMEKESGGSIVPCIIAHAASNFISSMVMSAVYSALFPK